MTEYRDRPEWLVPIFSYLEASSKQPQTGLALLNRSRSSIPVGPRHGDPFHRYLRAIPAWRIGLLSALWHVDPAHRCLSGILAWRRGLLSTLWHGDPAHRCFSGIPVWRTARRPVHDRQLTYPMAGLRHGDPAHRCLRGIPAWRSSHLLALRP